MNEAQEILFATIKNICNRAMEGCIDRPFDADDGPMDLSNLAFVDKGLDHTADRLIRHSEKFRQFPNGDRPPKSYGVFNLICILGHREGYPTENAAMQQNR